MYNRDIYSSDLTGLSWRSKELRYVQVLSTLPGTESSLNQWSCYCHRQSSWYQHLATVCQSFSYSTDVRILRWTVSEQEESSHWPMGKLRPKTNYTTLNLTRFGAYPFHLFFFSLSECETDISIGIALVVQAVGLIIHQKIHYGNSLVVQWFGLKAWIPFLVWEVTSCKSHGTAKKKRKSYMQVCAYFFPELGSRVACMLNCFSHVTFSATPWTIAHQAPLYGILQARILEWLPFPSPRDIPDPRIEPVSLAAPVLAGRSFTTEPPGKPLNSVHFYKTYSHIIYYHENLLKLVVSPFVDKKIRLRQLIWIIQSINLWETWDLVWDSGASLVAQW